MAKLIGSTNKLKLSSTQVNSFQHIKQNPLFKLSASALTDEVYLKASVHEEIIAKLLQSIEKSPAISMGSELVVALEYDGLFKDYSGRKFTIIDGIPMLIIFNIDVHSEYERPDSGLSVIVFKHDVKKFKQLIRSYVPGTISNLKEYECTVRGGINVKGSISPNVKHQQQFVKKEILDDLLTRTSRIINNPEYYTSKYRPVKEVVLLYGPPGTGKTTLTRYLSAVSGYDVYRVDPSFLPVFKIKPNTPKIILIEDIDTHEWLLRPEFVSGRNRQRLAVDDGFDIIGRGRNDNSRELGNYGDFINALDGLSSIENCIIIITTNFPEKIIESVLRSGRVHVKHRMDHPTMEEVVEYSKWSKRSVKAKYLFENHKQGDVQISMIPELMEASTIDDVKNILNQINTF